MATIIDLKEHIENGGKIRRPCWDKDTYIYLDNDEFREGRCLFYSNRELLLDDWEVYGEPFKITHTGLYKTRDGRMALVSFIRNSDYGVFGVIDGENYSRCWDISGEFWTGEENPEDIVAEWED